MPPPVNANVKRRNNIAIKRGLTEWLITEHDISQIRSTFPRKTSFVLVCGQNLPARNEILLLRHPYRPFHPKGSVIKYLVQIA